MQAKRHGEFGQHVSTKTNSNQAWRSIAALVLLLVTISIPSTAQQSSGSVLESAFSDTSVVQSLPPVRRPAVPPVSERWGRVPPVRPTALPPSQPLFESHEIIELTLKTDLLTVRNDVGEERDEHPATLSYTNEQGELVMLEATVRTRGRFRRDRRNCGFPPLRVDLKKIRFPEDQLVGTIFENQNELKLVCHCQDNSDAHEQFVLKEYLAYRVYQLFTDLSFSVRLVRMTYVDEIGRREPQTRFAFFIENEKMMAERNGAVVLDSVGVRQMDIDEGQAALFSFFQYFIGNTDWKVSVLHNVKLLDRDLGFPVAVPYDFDWAGAVDPPYAEPHPELGTRDVRDRVFISPCLTDYDIGRVIDLFEERRDAIYNLYSGLSALTERSRRRSVDYMDEFYEILTNPDAVNREFRRSCPGS